MSGRSALEERYDKRVIDALGLTGLVLLDEELDTLNDGRGRSTRSFRRLGVWNDLLWQIHEKHLGGSDALMDLEFGWTRAVIPVGCDGAYLTSSSIAGSVRRGHDRLVIASIHEVVDRRAWPQVYDAVANSNVLRGGSRLKDLEPFRSGHYYAEYAGDRMLILATSEKIAMELATLLKLSL